MNLLLRVFGIKDDPEPEPICRCPTCGRPLTWNPSFRSDADQVLDSYLRGYIDVAGLERGLDAALRR